MGPITCVEDAAVWRKRAEDMSKRLPPPPIPRLPDEHASDLSRYKNRLGVTPAEAWQKCADVVEKYDADTCRFHREEIDRLLVFAGLFSAVLTAFAIESYQWLQHDPNDAIISLLLQMAQTPGLADSVPEPGGLPDAVSVRINAYWFLSLALSLAAALIAILCKQWVREFERRAGQSDEQYISIRQMKLEGFEGWGVASIVAAIPVLLQSALGLFALGLIELLWKLNVAVALVALVPTLAAFVFYVVTTFLPGIQILCCANGILMSYSQCPFKSPQALGTTRVLVMLRSWTSACTPQILALVIFMHRKSVVFIRRCCWYWRQGFSPNLPSGTTGASYARSHTLSRRFRFFWARLLLPWQCDEDIFYDNYRDRPSLAAVRLCWRKMRRILAFCRPSQDSQDEAEKFDVWTVPCVWFRPFAPEAQHLTSWAALDWEFGVFRDSAYFLEKYESAVEFHANALPLRSCFRALAWLRDHFDQPAMQHSVWLSVWDITTDLAKRLYTRVSNDDDSAQRAIVRLMCDNKFVTFPTHSLGSSAPATPLDAALVYALSLELEPSFMAEIVIHHLPHIDRDLMWRILRLLMHSLREMDEDTKQSVVHALLVCALTWECNAAPDVRRLLLVAARSLGASMAQETLACIVAAYFRSLRSWNEGVLDARGDLQELFTLAVRCLAHHAGDGGYDPTVLQSTDMKAVLGTLVLALDRCFQQLPAHGASDDDHLFALNVLREPGRGIYLILLSGQDDLHTTTGGMDVSAAEDRFQRTVGRFARKRDKSPTRNDVRRRVRFASDEPPERSVYGMELESQSSGSS